MLSRKEGFRKLVVLFFLIVRFWVGVMLFEVLMYLGVTEVVRGGRFV